MRENQKRPFRAMALMSTILSQLVGSILVGIFLGKWLDKVFHTSPLLLIIGLLLGLVSGILGTMIIIKRFSGEDS